jgi:hypothetical protein
VKQPRPVKPIERGGRGLAGPRKLGQMPSGKGNTPVVLSRPRVLGGLYQIILDFMTSSTRVLSLCPLELYSNDIRVCFYPLRVFC